jgi:hypothetical protein
MEIHHLDLVFEVLPDAAAGETWIEFLEDPGTATLGGADNYLDPFIPRGDSTQRFQARPLLRARVDILPKPGAATFLRGDVNDDDTVSLSDVVTFLLRLFDGLRPRDACADAADSNDDGVLNLSDAVFTLSHLFRGGPQPAPPFPVEGVDPTGDEMDCP